jgi:hypothetical protein
MSLIFEINVLPADSVRDDSPLAFDLKKFCLASRGHAVAESKDGQSETPRLEALARAPTRGPRHMRTRRACAGGWKFSMNL